MLMNYVVRIKNIILRKFIMEQFMDPLTNVFNFTSLYTSRGRGNLRNDIHALVNFSFIFFAALLDDKVPVIYREKENNYR